MKERIQDVRKVRGPKNLSSVVACSTDVFKIQPVLCRETKHGDIFNIVHRQLNICDSLVVPAFVDIKCRNTWFYVPFSKLWQPFESVLGGTSIYIEGLSRKISQVPVLSPLLVLSILVQQGYCDCFNPTQKPETYDFRYKAHSVAGDYVYCVFTAKGRKIWNVLQGLGYKFQTYFEADNSNVVDMTTVGVSPSALPFLAYCKIFLENFVPSKYGDACNDLISRIYNHCGTTVVSGLTLSQGSSAYVPWTDGLTGPDSDWITLISELFEYLSRTYYGDDYFTSSPLHAMDAPDGTIDGVNFKDLSIELPNGGGTPNITHVVSKGSASPSSTPVHEGFASQDPNQETGTLSSRPANVSEYIHNMLQVVTKNIQLKALSGSKLAQRLYALYGSKSQVFNMEAAVLDQMVSELDVRSITSVADTEASGGASLGQKGGQLNGYGEKKLHYEFSEFGVIICVNQIIPTYFYGEGLHREMMHLTADDFYNDRYALAGYQNIARFELFSNDNLGYYKRSSLSPSGTFGKTSAYAEYALRKDNIFGDFNLLSRQAGTDAFHFNRYLVDQLEDMKYDKPVDSLAPLPENTEDFMQVVSPFGNTVDHQYDRIFTDSDAADDHIAQFNEFKITADRYGRNINDFTIGESDGHEVEMDGLGKVLYN